MDTRPDDKQAPPAQSGPDINEPIINRLTRQTDVREASYITGGKGNYMYTT